MAAVALRMPSSYVPIEEDEMEYVEGGISVTISFASTARAYSFCKNIGIKLQKFSYVGTIGSALVGGIIGLAIGGPGGALAGAIIGAALGFFTGTMAGAWGSSFIDCAYSLQDFEGSSLWNQAVSLKFTIMGLNLYVDPVRKA